MFYLECEMIDPDALIQRMRSRAVIRRVLAGQLKPQAARIDKNDTGLVPAPHHWEAQRLSVEPLQPREIAGIYGKVVSVSDAHCSLHATAK
jgi:hypothetical protein